LAVFNGHSDILRDILQSTDLRLDTEDRDGRTTLNWASKLDYDSVVRMLLDNRAELNIKGIHYSNALQAASLEGHTSVVQILLNKGAKAASENSHTSVVKILLDKGAEVNAQGGPYGNALQAALLGGHTLVIQILLDKGAEVDT